MKDGKEVAYSVRKIELIGAGLAFSDSKGTGVDVVELLAGSAGA